MIGLELPVSGINVSWNTAFRGAGNEVGAVCTTTGVGTLIEEGAIRNGIVSSIGWKRRRAYISSLLRLMDEHKQRYVYIYPRT